MHWVCERGIRAFDIQRSELALDPIEFEVRQVYRPDPLRPDR